MQLYCPVCRKETEHRVLSENHIDYQVTYNQCSRCRNARNINKRYFGSNDEYKEFRKKVPMKKRWF